MVRKTAAKDVHVVMFVEVKESFRRNGVKAQASFAYHGCRKPILVDPVLDLRFPNVQGGSEVLHGEKIAPDIPNPELVPL
ncbi:hypothetical protein ACPOL_6338 [Acidisarcina polymorpha]|uniref:Uncharacterized protein n=1 Tax=Acidisarcina polymorpha TaxID=2211140 RepID=A0A2Z5G8H5_9BACT|nr:hypothetical protein ACPOL_6338 [Acidisarcina polymorpha]